MEITEKVKVLGLVMHQSNGKTGLRFECQLCNHFIDDGELGLFVWEPDGVAVQAVHKACNNRAGDPYTFSQEIDTGLIYLLWNSGIRDDKTLNRAQENARAESTQLA